MAIIAFWSDEKKETGQTLSMAAITTYMAIEHNYKILNITTNFKDNTLEDCYWDNRININAPPIKGVIENNNPNVSAIGFDSGVEGLAKVIRSNKTTPNIVSNYTKVVFNGRLDVLCSPQTREYSEYKEIAKMYPEILSTANRHYDLVFVDVSKRMDKEDVNNILEIADLVVANITQRQTIIHKFYELRESNQFFKNNNVLINIGRYDKFSKYNEKNISRYIGMKRGVLAIPYNTLFFESCSDGKVADFFLRLRNIGVEDRNQHFISEVDKFSKELIYKLQELQIKM